MAKSKTPITTPAPLIDLGEVIALGVPRAVELWLRAEPNHRRRAEQLSDLKSDQARRVADLLTGPNARELLAGVDPVTAARFLLRLAPVTAARLLGLLAPEEAARALRETPQPERGQLVDQLQPAQAEAVRPLLAWPPESVGAWLTTAHVSVRPQTTVAQAARQVADHARLSDRSPGYVYVTEATGELCGLLSMRDLVVAPGDSPVERAMNPAPVVVTAAEDQERAARLLADHHFRELPVLDAGRLVGVISADDVAAILEQESTEDAERQGGSTPLEVPYLQASPWLLWRKRVVWIAVLFVAEMYTGTVMRAYEDELATVVALSFFIPLLIGTGGNTGTQIASTLVRAMATGQIRLRDLPRILGKELATACLIAGTMAALALARAYSLGVGHQVALTVALAIAAIVIWSALLASLLPLVIRRLGLDPAVVSSPLISTLVDGTGLIIYFTAAKLFISALA
ncbi:MAG: magnesium transporter [Propionibacteriaceae bacterium]|jgi:magnesium transporter|nr:magnesium transporter [Propionibacteriaceae bacterium]